jgi:hypothetical protein
MYMPTVNQILIQTHHIISRKKIAHITKAAKRLSCSVLLKTGTPPGLMVVESSSSTDMEAQDERRAEKWAEIVRVSVYCSRTPSRSTITDTTYLSLFATKISSFFTSTHIIPIRLV